MGDSCTIYKTGCSKSIYHPNKVTKKGSAVTNPTSIQLISPLCSLKKTKKKEKEKEKKQTKKISKHPTLHIKELKNYEQTLRLIKAKK